MARSSNLIVPAAIAEGIDTMICRQPTGISLRDTDGKGIGVFAERAFKEGRLVGVCPVLVLRRGSATILDQVVDSRGYAFSEYLFEWGKKSSGFPLGWAAFLNHSDDSNVDYVMRYERQLIEFTAHTNISPGEELTIDYGYGPEFE